jgi:molybdopterin-guanine dinucleotide biosynthesis protein A
MKRPAPKPRVFFIKERRAIRINLLSVFILAGGKSSRMGGIDKAMLPFLGEPLIARVVRRLAPISSELAIIGGQKDSLDFLNLPVFPDLLPEQGALGGLFTALSTAKGAAAVIGCDMPLVNPALLTAQARLLESSGADAVIPRVRAGLEPLHAVYNAPHCLTAVKQALERGERRVSAWLKHITLYEMNEDEISRIDPELVSFTNINTFEALAQAEALARALEKTRG